MTFEKNGDSKSNLMKYLFDTSVLVAAILTGHNQLVRLACRCSNKRKPDRSMELISTHTVAEL